VNPWRVFNEVIKGHTVVYRATGGLIGHRAPGLPPFLLLDHVGAKSGRRRTSPLVYVADGDDFVIVASKGGHPRHPGWFHNLRAHPETTIQVGSRRMPVTARVANPDERARLWRKAVAVWSGYEGYQERTDREIPLVILEPRA
jgi:deazaflavin-dependent oxidoreductase (nitroreductase family)